MSLADLYKDDASVGGSEDDDDQEDFVPSEASQSGDDDDGSDGQGQSAEDNEGGSAGSETDAGDTEQRDEQERKEQEYKRRIDALAQEMLAPAGPRKALRTASDESPSGSTSRQSEEPAGGEDGQPADAPPAAGSSGQGGPKRGPRRVSKFGKMAEQAERRRAAKGNTLDVARKAWVGFVAAEGIRDELDKANKDGYIERQEFLGRVDRRTYERSRDRGK
ncbi:swr complex subunit [Coemansia biformis]|uniref:SWR1-complex protein 5 n=1 Tax=Coemansia biformis TaxID=1286918 RepID=A0A9W8D1D8_9FUNG|nr:swr complex subunit [Coemansia biformis]